MLFLGIFLIILLLFSGRGVSKLSGSESLGRRRRRSKYSILLGEASNEIILYIWGIRIQFSTKICRKSFTKDLFPFSPLFLKEVNIL